MKSLVLNRKQLPSGETLECKVTFNKADELLIYDIIMPQKTYDGETFNFATPADVTAILVEPPLCMFKSPLLSAVVTTPPAPVVIAFIELAIYISLNHKITQREPLEIVTLRPPGIVKPLDPPTLFAL